MKTLTNELRLIKIIKAGKYSLYKILIKKRAKDLMSRSKSPFDRCYTKEEANYIIKNL